MPEKIETIKEFQKSFGEETPSSGVFYVNKRELVPIHTCLSSYHRDFYKISLINQGEGVLSFVGSDTIIDIKENSLVISNPQTPFKWKSITEKQTGFFCLFSKDFIQCNKEPGLLHLLDADKLVFHLNKDVASFIENIFQRIYSVAQSEYIYKYDLLCNYVKVILHEIIKEYEPENRPAYNASGRIYKMFQNLLDDRFLITSPDETIALRSPKDFARELGIHVNHLNRALKDYTGKTTTESITARILKESKSLLLHTNWTIAEIAYCLNFQHSSNFHIFFKKQTSLSPKEYRKLVISLT